MEKEDVAHVYNGVLVIKRNKIELFVMRWIAPESVIQSEVSQKERDKYRMLTHIYMEFKEKNVMKNLGLRQE